MSKCKIIGQRFLRKYTAPKKTPVYSAQIDVQTIAKTLCDVKWEKVSVKDAAMAYHDDKLLDNNVVERDAFDAALFCSDHKDGLHLAHANAAVYVYAMPDSAIGKTLSSLKINVTSDPYNANGARLHVMTSAELAIPTNCRICRGEDESGNIIADGSTLSRVAVRTVKTVSGTDYWYPTNETATIAPASLTLQKYLFVFVLMENYATVRGNWIEGCSYISNNVEIETVENVDGWTDGETYDLSNSESHEYNVCRGGILPLATSQGVKSLTIMADGSDIPVVSGETKYQISSLSTSLRSVLATLDGPITGVYGDHPTVAKHGQIQSGDTFYMAAHYIAIVGRFTQRSFTNIPGLLLYDVRRGMILSDLQVNGDVNAAIISRISGGGVSDVSFSVSSVTVTSGTNSETVCELVLSMFVYLKKGCITDGVITNGPSRLMTLTLDGETLEVKKVESVNNLKILESMTCQYGVTSAFDNTLKYGTLTACVAIASNKIKVLNAMGTILSGVAYEGEITSVRSATPSILGGYYGFLVSGNLKKVNGVDVENCALVRFDNNGNVDVSVPAFASQITPDTFENYSVGALGGSFEQSSMNTMFIIESDACIVSGAYNSLSGDGTIKKLALIRDSKPTSVAEIGDDTQAVVGAVGVLTTEGTETFAGVVTGAKAAYNVSDINSNITAEQTCIGLRTAYAKLYTGAIPSVDSNAAAVKRAGAGFVIKKGSIALTDSVSVPTWQMILASLAVPLAVPQDFAATGVRLDWPKLAATGGKLNVWLKRESYVTETPEITDASIYLGNIMNVAGWELIGQINSDQTSARFKFDRLTGRTATLMFTAFISLDSLNPSDAMTMPQGVATALDVDPITGAVAGLDTTWKPDITLIG